MHPQQYPSPYQLKLRPDTKATDVLAYLNLTDDYVLSLMSDPAKTFSPEENLYGQIENDQKLIAKLSPQATAKYAQLFIQ